MKASRLVIIALLSTALSPLPALAEPPSHAPAHGWRKKNDPNYVGYTGHKWAKDYGVVEGKCNTAAVGAVLGGAVGGVIGINRDLADKPIGVRTLALVALSAAIVTVATIQVPGIAEHPDALSRVVQGVLQGVMAGIGFIGAGVILRDAEAGIVLGLTTAATVWVAAALGIACGLGASFGRYQQQGCRHRRRERAQRELTCRHAFTIRERAVSVSSRMRCGGIRASRS